jgi:ABC-type nitrate/sulfonate/bicarbonate transport system permease component
LAATGPYPPAARHRLSSRGYSCRLDREGNRATCLAEHRLWAAADCSRAFPATALITLIWLVFGVAAAPGEFDYGRSVIVAVAVFFPVAYCARMSAASRGWTTSTAAASAAPRGGEAPFAAPAVDEVRWVFAGLKLASGAAMMTLIAAEMISTKIGLGYVIWASWQTFSVETMYVGITVTGVLGSLMWSVLAALEWLLLVTLPRKPTSGATLNHGEVSDTARS